jgi:hypothetical protein
MKGTGMWARISLKYRSYLLLAAIFLVTLSGAAVMVWYSYSIEGVLTTITDENLVAFQSAESLEIALVNQKGFVSYYFQDGNPGLAGPAGGVPPGVPGTAGPGTRIGPVSRTEGNHQPNCRRL